MEIIKPTAPPHLEKLGKIRNLGMVPVQLRMNKWLGFWLVVLMLVSCCPIHAAPGNRPVWIKPVGKYRLVKWDRGWNSNSDIRQAIIVRDQRGEEVARLRNHFVDLEYVGDLNGDGHNDAIISSSESGAHGPSYYHVYSLGPRPHCLLAYAKNNVEDGFGGTDFTLRDLNGDGRKEIISWYDGFAYWGGGGRDWECSYAGAARLPVVLGLRGSRYVDVTRGYRSRLIRAVREAEASLRRAVITSKGEPLVGQNTQPIISTYAIKAFLDGRTKARKFVTARLPQIDRRVFLRNEPRVWDVIQSRLERYVYPAVYTDANVFKSGDHVPNIASEKRSARR